MRIARIGSNTLIHHLFPVVDDDIINICFADKRCRVPAGKAAHVPHKGPGTARRGCGGPYIIHNSIYRGAVTLLPAAWKMVAKLRHPYAINTILFHPLEMAHYRLRVLRAVQV